jgi:hypothetical protein
MILIYADRYSSRLRYSLDLIFHTFLATDYRLTHDPETILAEQGPRIAYAADPQIFDGALAIRTAELLFEKGLKDQNIAIGQHLDTKTLFRTSKRYPLPYDIFAAVFYLVSRYEEYLPHRSDEHDRYLHTESIAWREGFLETAIVEMARTGPSETGIPLHSDYRHRPIVRLPAKKLDKNCRWSDFRTAAWALAMVPAPFTGAFRYTNRSFRYLCLAT